MKKIHGDGNAPLYKSWKEMRRRCNSFTRPQYVRYGARGIRICKEWTVYLDFKQWALKSGYQNGLVIHRVDNDAGYNPLNCKWITKGKHTAIHNCIKRKITFSDAQNIRKQYRANLLTKKAALIRYKISYAAIRHILENKTYKEEIIH